MEYRSISRSIKKHDNITTNGVGGVLVEKHCYQVSYDSQVS